MKLISVFLISIREQARNILELCLSLIFAPLFVLLYYFLIPSGSTTYAVMIQNNDVGVQLTDGTVYNAGNIFIESLKNLKYPSGNPLLKISTTNSSSEAETKLRNRDVAVFLVISQNFSESLKTFQQEQTSLPSSATFIGDLTNPYYAVAAVMVNATLEQFTREAVGQSSPVKIAENPLGGSGARTEFENYVPGLLVFAIIMLIFSAAISITRDVESGVINCLKITRMTSWDYLGGVSFSLVLVGVLSVCLTFLTACALGFRSQGPMWIAIFACILTCLSVIGASLIVACLSKNVTQAFLIANFPLGLFMFLSGVVYPMPRVTLFSLAGHPVGLFDFLPPSLAVSALNKVFTLGAGFSDVIYELSALFILSMLYFAVGVWLFKKTHMRVV